MTLKTQDAVLFYDESIKTVAVETAGIYPSVSAGLEKTLGLKTNFKPEIVLVKGRQKFRDIAGSDLIVAFAVPRKNLISIDTSRVFTKPFSLEATLRHELCHLALHHNIESANLPRWLDEGICQWASGGIAELEMEGQGSAVSRAIVSDSIIPLRELDRFPNEKRALVLAYEESKSVVEYIASEYGSDKIPAILQNLHYGKNPEEAISTALSVSPNELEKNWIQHLRKKHTFFTYFSNNIYTVVFTFLALMTVYGFIRLIQKKRAYKDEDEQPEDTI